MSRLWHRVFVFSGFVSVLALASTARGVAITNDSLNTSAPANDPGWNNVAHMSGATAVYLGDGWMITANHVSDGPVSFSNGQVINVLPGSDVGFFNPSSTGAPLTGMTPDLRMFHLATTPNLPSLQVSTTTPTAGTTVTMIGAGLDHSPNLIGWDINSTTLAWTPVALPFAQVTGFSLLSTSEMRWGMNRIESGGDVAASPNGSTTVGSAAFATLFSRNSIPYAAQAVSGDSGGGVFQQVGGHWQLAGIIDEQAPVNAGQPGGTVAFGEQSYSIDLSLYASQIAQIMNLKLPAWQNLVNPLDVVRSGGAVEPLDALALINALTSAGHSFAPTGTPGPTDPLLDVNGDGLVSALDLLDIINALTPPTPAKPSLATANAVLAPEPSTAMLAAWGVLFLFVASRIARRARMVGAA